MATPPEPPTPIEGERKEQDNGCASFTVRGDDGEFKMTFWNYSEDKEYTFNYTVTNTDSCQPLGDTENPEPGQFIVTLHPGEIKEFFEGTYIGGWRGGWKWKSPPSKEWTEQQNEKYMAVGPRHVEAVKNLLINCGIEDPMSLTSSQIANICQSRGLPFCDLHFPPVKNPSLFREFEHSGASLHSTDICNRTLPFLRPCDFLKHFETTETPELFAGKISVDDFDQGSLGNCFYACAVAALAEHPRRIKNLFLPLQQNLDLGIFRVRMAKSKGINGWFETLTMDDYFPTSNKMRIFCKNRSEPNELWVSIMEKAYAYLHGSYKSIAGGSAGQATSDIIGFPYQALSELECWDDGEARSDALWNYLLDADKKHHAISLSTPQMSEGRSNEEYDEVGLAKSHAWTLIALYEWNGVRLCLIRNPWGSATESKLKWSDHDDSDEANQMRADLGIKKGDDGTFLMEWSMVLGSMTVDENWFSGGYVIFGLENCASVRVRGAWENAVPSHAYKVTIADGATGEIELYCSLHQRDRRGLTEDDPDQKYQAIRVSIGKQAAEGAEGRLEPIALSHHKYFMQSRDQYARCTINCEENAGAVYWCLPLCYDEDCSKKFNTCLFVSDPSAVKVEIVSVGDQGGNHLTRAEYYDPTQCDGAGSPAPVTWMETPTIQVTLPSSVYPCEGTNETVCTMEMPADGVVDFNQAHAMLDELNAGRQPRQNVIANIQKTKEAIARLDKFIDEGEMPEETDEFPPVNATDEYSAATAPKPANAVIYQAQIGGDDAEPWEPIYELNQDVMARWKPGKKHYPGSIVLVDQDTRTYAVAFDDGDFAYNILESDVRPRADGASLEEEFYNMIHKSKFVPGELVQAKFNGSQYFYQSMVTSVNDDHTYSIKFDDGTISPSVPFTDLRKANANQRIGKEKNFERLDNVFCRWKGGATWYPAVLHDVYDDEQMGIRFFSVQYSANCYEMYILGHNLRSKEEHEQILAEGGSGQGSGFIDDEQTHAVLWQMFSDADHDQSGALDRAECLAVFATMFPSESITQILARIREADANEDGTLDFEEFYAVARDSIGRG